MVDSPPSQSLTLNHSENSYTFPPHRRRPLRSRTYSALTQILSHCRTTCSPLKLQKLQVDSDDFESEPVNKEDGPVTCNESNSADDLVSLPNSKGSNDMGVQEDSNDKNKEKTGFLDGSFDDKQETNSVTDEQQEVTPSNGISIEDYLVVENPTVDCASQKTKEQEKVNSVLDIQMDGFEVDKEFSIDNFNEVFEVCFGLDVDVASSKGEDCQDKGTGLGNIPNDAEHELKLKEMELEKLIHSSSGVESSFCLNADEEIEEGEISADAAVAREPLDTLSDDAATLGERTAEKMHASEDCFDNDDRGRPYKETSDPSPVSVVNCGGNSMSMESRAPDGQMQDCPTQNILPGNHMEPQRSGAIVPCLENLSPSGRTLQLNVAEVISSCTAEKDPSKMKRKRGPLTKEKREKKKRKKGLKRAEKNRKDGVKRLKLQPVLQPKKIVYCRHYLQGRCYEGDKCSFSHDTVPLTKAKPCGHFARHSCMKGDECPYDHELSKYPCKNYASNGFCNRGSECLFSHEMPAKSCSITPSVSKPDLTSAQHTMFDKGGSSSRSKVTKPESKLLSPLNNSNSSKHMDNHGVLHQKVDPKHCSASSSPGQSAELLTAKPVHRAGGQPPRGVSFLLNKRMQLGDTNKDKQDESSTKSPDGICVGHKETPKVPSGMSELNKMSEVAGPRKPRGINFLSFGQPSTSLALNLTERINGTPLDVTQHVNITSFNRTHLDDSISNATTTIHFSKADTALSLVDERPSTSKLQDAVKTPSLSFGGHWDQSTSRLNANPSSPFKKPLLSAPSSVQKAVQSTLAFAAKLAPDIKVGSSLHQRES